MKSEGRGEASGKVILLGEHAVVYGVPALAAGISRGARARVTLSDKSVIEINGTRLPSDHELGRGLAFFLAKLGLDPVRLEATLDVPPGSGLGGSAALGVATLRALLDASGRTLREDEFLRLADGWEDIFHGKASGVDARAAYYGTVIRFVRGLEPVRVVPRKSFPLVVSVAAPPASTKLMVESVRRIKETRPIVFEKAIAGIAALVENAAGCLREGDLVGLGKLMDLNQMLLGSLLLSTEELEAACAVAREAGALGAKLTGSGGGGAIIALAPDDPERIARALESEGFPSFIATIGIDTP